MAGSILIFCFQTADINTVRRDLRLIARRQYRGLSKAVFVKIEGGFNYFRIENASAKKDNVGLMKWNNKMKKALVLAGGVPQIQLIKELKKRNYNVILSDYLEKPVAEKYADHVYRESTLDVDAIRKIAIKEGVEIIITCCTDQALATVSKISDELGLCCYLNAESGLYVTNKQYMKEIFWDNGIPTAKYQIVRSYDECGEYMYPVVVKPVDCNSSKGVVKAYCEEELQGLVRYAVEISRTNTAIVEEYIEGRELSIDLFVVNGKSNILCVSLSDKLKDDSKFVICRGMYPALISESIHKKIEYIAQKIVDAFGLKNCPMLMQVIEKDDDIYVLEFSARTGGCIKYHMIELASGIDVIASTVDLFEGKIPKIKPEISEKTIINEFIYCNPGVFGELKGFQECIENGFLESVFQLKSAGTIFDTITNSGDRVAAVTYVTDTYTEYVDKHNQVKERIQVMDIDGNDIMRHDLFKIP